MLVTGASRAASSTAISSLLLFSRRGKHDFDFLFRQKDKDSLLLGSLLGIEKGRPRFFLPPSVRALEGLFLLAVCSFDQIRETWTNLVGLRQRSLAGSGLKHLMVEAPPKSPSQ